MFFFTGLLFWARVIDPGPLRPRLVWPMRIAYTAGAMVVGWVLAITLVVIQHPIYGYYAALRDAPRRDQRADRPADRRRASCGCPDRIAYTITMLIGFYRWLEPDRSATATSAAFTT